MTMVHLVTGGDEARRQRLVSDLRTAGVTRVLTWGSGLVTPGAHALDLQDVDALAPTSLADLDAAGRALLADLDLPGDVATDLLAGLGDPDLRALLGIAAALTSTGSHAARTRAGAQLVVLVPVESDPARLVALPARAARIARALVPLLARWDALVAPPGIGALRRPQPATLAAAREVADLLEPLDALLAGDAVVHHLPGPGLVEAARAVDLTIALALMGRVLGEDPAGGGGDAEAPEGPPFALRLPLPGLTADEIVLEREGDDVVVTVGRHSRSTRLSALHRRCVITEARMRQGVLTLELEPDSGEWPR